MSKMRPTQHVSTLDSPRQKLRRKGASVLSDFELLELTLEPDFGNRASYFAKQLQRLIHHTPHELQFDDLMSIEGFDESMATRLLASLEITKRHYVRHVSPIKTDHDILLRLTELRQKNQEHFVCLSLDGGQRLIAQRTITIGTLDTVLAHPREVFADPIADRAASIIVAHNHPSGSVQPSPKDTALTQQLAASGRLLGIPLRDHLIVTTTEAYSFQQHHRL